MASKAIHNDLPYQLKVRFVDCILEDDMADQLPISRIGCFVQYDGQFIEALMTQEGAAQLKMEHTSTTLDLANSPSTVDPKLVFIVKDLHNEEPYVGSVSISRSIVMEGTLDKTYRMWITLFDDQNDDEYDGAMGVNDEEQPRILVEMTMVENQPEVSLVSEPEPVPKQVTREPSPNRKSLPKKATVPESRSYMKGIGNSRKTTDPAPQQPAPVRTSSVGKKKVAAPSSNRRQVTRAVAPPQQAAAQRLAQPTKSTISKPSGTMRETVQLDDIQSILDRNPNNRQNVNFLKDLLDSQLNKLCTNLKVMQGDNSEIETETIQRLQLIDKFGNDAQIGLNGAQDTNSRFKQDLTEQKSQHSEVMQEQNQQKIELESKLEDLTRNLAGIRKSLADKQSTHRKTMLTTQEVSQVNLNAMKGELSSRKASPSRRDEDPEVQRASLRQTQSEVEEKVEQLRDFRRNVPTTAADFQFEVEQLSASIEVLIEQNADMKGDIICLEEQKKSEKLIAALEEETIERYKFDLERLQEREKQLEEELTEQIEKGDVIYQQVRQKVEEQTFTEKDLAERFNTLANRQNMLLRSKLNYNKGDFERLRELGQIKGGAMGSELERLVAQDDTTRTQILDNKKGEFSGLLEETHSLFTDIGTRQKPFIPDLRQVENMCKMLDEKDVDLLKTLMPQKDQSEREYLANQVSNGLRDIMQGDLVDIEQHISFNQSGIDKLKRMLEKHKLLKDKQTEIFASQQTTQRNMKEQITHLSAEKEATIKKIEKLKKELEELLAQLDKLKAETDRRDEEIARLDQEIDAKYDEMEEYEAEIDLKNQEIKQLQSQLAQLLNRAAPAKFQIYKPIAGDIVDEKLAEYINQYGSPVPWVRDAAGNYTYGTKKVNVKFMRNNLIIKVGGGSMVVEEFIATYEDIELAKLNYVKPGAYVPLNQNNANLSKQQRISLARGASPRGSVLSGSPKTSKKF